MDPIANMKEQLELARDIQNQNDSEGLIDTDDAVHLAELVLALDNWKKKGGFTA